jgi:ABC-2 type transport system permease protein
VTGDGSALARLFGATIPYVVPVLLLVAVTWLAYGFSPRAANAGWLALTFCFVVMFFGELFRFPEWVVELSPFSHMPLMPAQPFDVTPVLVLLAITVLVGWAGLSALRRRDLV